MEEELIELINKLKNNKMEYFDSFFELTKKKVFFAAYSIIQDYSLAEDFLQNTFVIFLENINKIDTNKSILSYLITIARNQALNYINKHNKISSIEDFKETFHSDDNLNSYKELIPLLKKILDPIDFQILILHVVDELKHREIAEILKLPLGTITYKYNQTIKKIQEELKDAYWKRN